MTAKAGVIDSDSTKLRFVPIGAITMREGFWKTKMDANHERGIPTLMRLLEDHGVVDNFRIVSGRKDAERRGPFFSDSDLYKWMEGVALDLQTYDDPKLSAELNRLIDEVAAAQGEDGYLNTFFQGPLYGQRFRNMPVEHELYCAGHLFQAAVAHYRTTGEDKLLNVARKYADYLCSVFGYDKKQGVDGHPEIEMALVELYRTTGETSYLELAEYFLTQLGYTGRDQLSGHAVKELYTCCGGADYYAETGDMAYADASHGLWDNLVSKTLYITGGVGARHEGEAIGESYELPNRRAYAETCASIANAMFNYRMLAIHGEAKFADEMERALYNGVISGVSLEGTTYFYENPLACYLPHERQEWFETVCCPPNVIRTLAGLPGYMYSTSEDGVWVHLFDSSRVEHSLEDGTPFVLEQSTGYPWDGSVRLKLGLGQAKLFTLYLRIPGWCANAAVSVNGESVGVSLRSGSYAAIKRNWEDGDTIDLRMEMPVALIECDPRVRENHGSAAVTRGPLVYCAESTDNPGVSIMDLELAHGELEAGFEPDLLGGVTVVRGKGLCTEISSERGPLYRPAGTNRPDLHETPITLIPYFAWANRGPADMTVWMPYERNRR